MTHKDDVEYRYEFLSGADLEGWSYTKSDSGSYQATGPCPECKGDAYGPDNLETGEAATGEGARMAKEQVEERRGVWASCHCRYLHGTDDQSSCGRYFLVPVG